MQQQQCEKLNTPHHSTGFYPALAAKTWSNRGILAHLFLYNIASAMRFGDIRFIYIHLQLVWGGCVDMLCFWFSSNMVLCVMARHESGRVQRKLFQKTSGGLLNSSKQMIVVQSFHYIAQLHWICWDCDSWWRQQLSHYRMTDFKLLYNPSQIDLTDFPDQHLLLGIVLTHLNAPNCQSFFFYRGAHAFRFAFDWPIMNQCVICHLVT